MYKHVLPPSEDATAVVGKRRKFAGASKAKAFRKGHHQKIRFLEDKKPNRRTTVKPPEEPRSRPIAPSTVDVFASLRF